MLKRLLTLVIIFSVAIMPTLASAATINDKRVSDATLEEIEAMAMELEYIFTEIAVKDEATGDYVINHQELNNSSYSDVEKASIEGFADYMNSRGAISIQSNVFERCWADAVGISGAVLDEFLGYVENQDWIAAAGILALAGISVHPISIFIFSLTCGANPVE
ncbi:hypothetical protein [Lentibacillus sediminis]|uniref:hypothetical protein n=1 Tax=Lentibacillus sediminis TaxID=1940529 RepID=UPI000C1BEB32|nr:hypothetical protein [Lentibacillus sediminis]